MRTREIMRRRGGAVLADSVGLGKTYIALALIQEALLGGGDVVVVVPAAVRGLWRRVLGRLTTEAARPRLFSHTQLALGRAARGGGPTLVVVDEAHRFRNPRTFRHAALARLVGQGSRVLLITATPVNNGPDDLLHLLRLFACDDGFRDVGVPSLRDAFGAGAGAAIGDNAQVAVVIRAVVVRRTRAMVRDRFGTASTGPRFPERAPPRLVLYARPDLPGAVRSIARLELAPYALRPGDTGSASGASALIRLNLLKRLDSSPAAFEVSLVRLQRLLLMSLNAARSGRILAPEGHGTGGHGRDADPLQLTLIELITDPARPDMDLPEMVSSLERDVERVGGLLTATRDATRDSARDSARDSTRGATQDRTRGVDPKQAALTALLQDIGGEKVVVFTEYRDTAEALWRTLAPRHRVGRVDGAGAWLGLRPAGRRLVVERFAPRSNGRPPPPRLEGVDVLIATDVLSEGVNLQDARHVVSYDLPWNPVRLLQRIGRVDRLGSPHDVIVPYLFAPDDGLEEMLGLTRRLRRKLGHIAATVGAEQADDLLGHLARSGRSGRPDKADQPRRSRDQRSVRIQDALEELEAAPPLDAAVDPMEALRTLWIQNRAAAGIDAGIPLGGIHVPHGHPSATLQWVLLVDHAGTPTLLEMGRDRAISGFGIRSVAVLSLALRSSAVNVGPPPHRIPMEEVRAHFRARPASDSPPRLSPQEPGSRLVRRIRTAMARAGSALDPGTLYRADRLLARLTAPLDPCTEARVRALLSCFPETSTSAVLARAEAALGTPRAEDQVVPARSSSPTTAELMAALRIIPSDPSGTK